MSGEATDRPEHTTPAPQGTGERERVSALLEEHDPPRLAPRELLQVVLVGALLVATVLVGSVLVATGG